MLKPIFDFNKDTLLLHKGIARVTTNNKTFAATAKIILKFLPKPSLLIKTESLHIEHADIFHSNINQFTINHKKFDVLPISSKINISKKPILKIDWVPKKESIDYVVNSDEHSKIIIFHLFNFINFTGSDSFIYTEDNASYILELLNLEYENFIIKIQSLPETSNNIKYSEKNAYSKITHICSLEKTNGFISKDEYKNLKSALQYFLSFAKGSWIKPICSVGISKDNNPIWYEYSSPYNNWKSPTSWFSEHHASSLNSLFPLFMKMWSIDRWQDTLKEVVYWYLNANDGGRGVDAGLILLQTALERLSYEYIVFDKKLLSSKGFKDIWASDKFRLLFGTLNIPLNIPDYLPSLIKKSKEMNWLDAPHALTEIRNSLVHPEHKKHGKFDTNVFIEAYNLSLWYLELSILAICGYRDSYHNRLLRGQWIGKVEEVPWA